MGRLHLSIIVLEDQLDLVVEEGSSSADRSNPDSQSSRGHIKDMAKAIAKKAKKGALDLKHVLSPKYSRRRLVARDISVDSEFSHESSMLTPSVEKTKIPLSMVFALPKPKKHIVGDKENLFL
ncbi:hypothetical protein ACFE04_011270 [Oxalis oulophora]